MSEAQRTIAAVAAMAYDPDDWETVHNTLLGVLDPQEALLHAVWIAGELARRLARYTGQPLGELLALLADDYQA